MVECQCVLQATIALERVQAIVQHICTANRLFASPTQCIQNRIYAMATLLACRMINEVWFALYHSSSFKVLRKMLSSTCQQTILQTGTAIANDTAPRERVNPPCSRKFPQRHLDDLWASCMQIILTTLPRLTSWHTMRACIVLVVGI